MQERYRLVEMEDGLFVLLHHPADSSPGWAVVAQFTRAQVHELWGQMGHVLRTDRDEHRNDGKATT